MTKTIGTMGNKDSPQVVVMTEKPSLDGDWLNFCLLIVFYVIQGFSIGLSIAVPIILQSKQTVTYEDQATFSVALWPYMMKIIWAPIVDALYVQRIGRRKSWVLPLQLLMVAFLLIMAKNIDTWLPETGKPNIKMIVLIVFIFNFLSATQDIAVDGWSLTMLKKKNVSHASTCNSVGVPIGMFIGSVCFTLLVSEQFSNKYLRTEPGPGGLITMKSFLYAWTFMVLSVTFFVALFVKEKRHTAVDGYKKISVFQNYQLLWDVLKLPGIKVLAIALLTTRIGFTATEIVSPLKLIDAGVSKDDIMIVTTVLYAVKFIMPIFVSKYVTSPNPISYYLKMTPFRLLWGVVFAVFVYFTPTLLNNNNNGTTNVPWYYYLLLGVVYLINEMLSFFMMLTLFAFFCQISNPSFGGTYMTLFNTFYFLGYLIPNTFVLKLVNELTFSKCSVDAQNFCSTSSLKFACKANQGSCIGYMDGYYITTAMCTALGFIWFGVFRKIIVKYQSLGLFHYVGYDRPLQQTKEELYSAA